MVSEITPSNPFLLSKIFFYSLSKSWVMISCCFSCFHLKRSSFNSSTPTEPRSPAPWALQSNGVGDPLERPRAAWKTEGEALSLEAAVRFVFPSFWGVCFLVCFYVFWCVFWFIVLFFLCFGGVSFPKNGNMELRWKFLVCKAGGKGRWFQYSCLFRAFQKDMFLFWREWFLALSKTKKIYKSTHHSTPIQPIAADGRLIVAKKFLTAAMCSAPSSGLVDRKNWGFLMSFNGSSLITCFLKKC